MFLKLAHTNLDTYQHTKNLVIESYRISKTIPSEERYSLTQQLRRAAVSVHLNFAEGCARISAAEQLRFMEIARASLVEVDTALDVAVSLDYIKADELTGLGDLITRSFSCLTGMIKNCRKAQASK